MDAKYDSDEQEVRTKKIIELREKGLIYKGKFEKTHKASDVLGMDESSFRSSEEVLAGPNGSIKTAGRIISVRDHGGILFMDIQDRWGELQISFTEKILGEEKIKFIQEYIDLGDFIGITGEPFITKQGKLAILSKEYSLLTKAARPMPTQHSGFEDIELRYRKRYLDLVLNKDVKERFETRSRVVESLRQWLLRNDFVEVVTRTLQPVAGGAVAENFVTHHNALNHDFVLRISNELDLKMAVAGGLERVFEFSIDFRNEGIDSSHLQEFQMLEWYCAYKDYEVGIEFTKQMILEAVKAGIGDTKFDLVDREGKTHTVDLSKEIPIKTFTSLLKEEGVDIFATKDWLLDYAKKNNLEIESPQKRSRANLLDDVYKKVIRPKLIEPIFITNHPADLLPLARRSDENKELVDSYQLVIGTWEILKGYSELVDPIDQANAFKEQMEAKEGGDVEAMQTNTEFLTAMEHGMPPMTGWGMGIDRFVTLITGASNLKETVLFPLLSPKEDN